MFGSLYVGGIDLEVIYGWLLEDFWGYGRFLKWVDDEFNYFFWGVLYERFLRVGDDDYGYLVWFVRFIEDDYCYLFEGVFRRFEKGGYGYVEEDFYDR